MNIKNFIKNIPNFPKPGILFKDISPMLASPEAMRYVTFELAEKCKDADIITGLDARGFLFGIMVAELLEKPFVMIRKKGKLPGKTYEKNYGLEYGNDTIEIQSDSIKSGQKVAIIDDLLATGGTMMAAIELIEKSGGKLNNISFVISLDDEELSSLPNREKLKNYEYSSIIQYS
ncbi:MAG: adenine phosphoribosyltransferase [Candidatus Gracilibacteria bacterium]|nr:adenine phosphoribosyltransferase [Candidatus Gracilibacteria bacterium]